MFRSAATKIAHNSTLPALGTSKDLRPLQELITSEKAVLQSLQKLSSDLTKSSEYLRQWGAGEGDDLQDVLSASTSILIHLANALNQLANHEASIRERMKSVRTQEEHLDELRRRRKALNAKADAAEKKLSRMSPEHKSLQQQTQLLDSFRDQIRSMDWEILSTETKVGDLKRSEAKNWMMLKFGGILECAEKATIVGEMGKLVIQEIPLQVTTPGQSRTNYSGYEKTDKLVSETQRCISEVVFDFQPDLLSSGPLSAQEQPDILAGTVDGLPRGSNAQSSMYLQNTMPNPAIGSGSAQADEFGGLGYGERQQSRGYDTMPASGVASRAVDDGLYIGGNFENSAMNAPISSSYIPASPPQFNQGGPGASHMSTFPSRKLSFPPTSSFTTTSPPSVPQNISFEPYQGHEDGPGFAAEVASALAYAEGNGSSQDKSPLTPNKSGPGFESSSNAPQYEQSQWTATSGLPKGAAPPLERNPWDNLPSPPQASAYQTDYSYNSGQPTILTLSPDQKRNSFYPDDGSETQLPYASPPLSSPQRLAPINTDQREVDRHTDTGYQLSDSRLGQDSNEQGDMTGVTDPQARNSSEQQSYEKHDSASLNAAAMREVTREMDALIFSPPPGPPPTHPDYQQYEKNVSLQNRTPSPLLPPAPPFAQQPHLSISSTESAPAPDLLSPKSGYETLAEINIPSSPNTSQPTRPSLLSSSTSPTNSYNTSLLQSPSYGSPPELSSIQPLRTGSPTTFTPGSRTISASAFKRPAARSPSGSVSSSTLPDVSPLSLRKKGGTSPALPSSPQPSGLNQEGRRSIDSTSAPAPEYTEFATPYGESSQLQSHPSSGSGYGRGKFAKNLEEEDTLR